MIIGCCSAKIEHNIYIIDDVFSITSRSRNKQSQAFFFHAAKLESIYENQKESVKVVTKSMDI